MNRCLNINVIHEAVTDSKSTIISTSPTGKPVAETILQDLEVGNRNTRLYTVAGMRPEVEGDRIQKELIPTGNMRAHNGHPSEDSLGIQTTIDPKLCCAIFLKIWMENTIIKAHYTGTNNAYGNELMADLQCGYSPSWSMRGLGSVEIDRKTGLSIVKNPKIITWDRVIFPSHKIAYTSGIIGTVTNGVNYSMKESANIYTTKALQSLKESYSMISDIEAMNGNVLTFNANEVNEFIKNESANLNFLKETLGIIKDSTFLCDGNKNVCVTLESGEKAIVPLEDHIFSAILDYCDK